jgi:hypothetical protein
MEKKSKSTLILESVGAGALITVWIMTFLPKITIVPVVAITIISGFCLLARYLYILAREGKI